MEKVPSLYACICHHCSQPASSNHHMYFSPSLPLFKGSAGHTGAGFVPDCLLVETCILAHEISECI